MTTPDVTQSRVGSIRDVTLAVVIASALLCGLWWLSVRGTQNEDSSLLVLDVPVTLEPRLMLGHAEAPAVIVVASDFQCPFCAAFATQTLPQMRTALVESGKVSLYFRHLIGPTHRLAAAAAALAECADTTGDFWRIHDQLFATPPFLIESVINRLKDSGMGTKGSVPCSEAPAAVKRDTRWARQLGATGTPFFFFGKRVGDNKVLLKYAFGGVRPLADFRNVVDRLVE
jgi:protein-disulfide isomerase